MLEESGLDTWTHTATTQQCFFFHLNVGGIWFGSMNTRCHHTAMLLLPVKCTTSICWRFWHMWGGLLYEKCIHKDAWMYWSEAVGAWEASPDVWICSRGGRGGKPRCMDLRPWGQGRQAQIWSCAGWWPPQAPEAAYSSLGLFLGTMASVFCSAGVRYRIQ